ncbi:dTDP-4-dehydrorhamnose reductase [Corynebacterium sp. H113]|uniref:dTDP-4-dehydrorhamnose reductase n=1 Tax=Corynebacterium sp. H113 TaxID=3133419 RepID=UPI0030AB1418
MTRATMTGNHATHFPHLSSQDAPARTAVILGAAGQLGTALQASAPESVEVRALTRQQLDVTDAQAVAKHPAFVGADVVINAAAYTDVDGAEEHVDAAYALNAVAPGLLAARAAAEGSHFIHVSTDYVFGESALRRPWTPTDPTNPHTAYGKTKRAGELAVFNATAQATVVRTAWVWSGPTQPQAKDFVSTMLNLENRTAPDGTIKVVNDQHGNPTFVGDLAAALWECALRPVPGIFHVTGSGTATWNDLAREVFRAVGADPTRVLMCDSSEFPTPARRPAWSVLDGQAWVEAGFAPLPEWRDALTKVLT